MTHGIVYGVSLILPGIDSNWSRSQASYWRCTAEPADGASQVEDMVLIIFRPCLGSQGMMEVTLFEPNAPSHRAQVLIQSQLGIRKTKRHVMPFPLPY